MYAGNGRNAASPAGGAELPPGLSVEAHWPPLTPEHGFPSLHIRPGRRALPLRPARAKIPERLIVSGRAPPIGEFKQESERAPRQGALDLSSTPYAGITRIRSRVEAHASSQPHSSPVLSSVLSHRAPDLSSAGARRALSRSSTPSPAPPVRRSPHPGGQPPRAARGCPGHARRRGARTRASRPGIPRRDRLF